MPEEFDQSKSVVYCSLLSFPSLLPPFPVHPGVLPQVSRPPCESRGNAGKFRSLPSGEPSFSLHTLSPVNHEGIKASYHQLAIPYRPPASLAAVGRPIDFLLDDLNPSRRPFVYHGRDIVKENTRVVRFQRPPKAPQRHAPPFSLQLKQKNVTVQPPKSIMKRSRSAETQSEESQKFAVLYGRGDLPVMLEHSGGSGEPPRSLRWSRHPRQLADEELSSLLQKFSLGLAILHQPLRNVAEWGMTDLLEAVSCPDPVLDSLPQLVRGLRPMLSSLDEAKKKVGLRLMTQVSRIAGPSLVPFYRQLLPPLRKVDQSWRGSSSLEMETETALNDLERTGGPTAFINMKYILPSYESYRPRF